MPRPVRIEYPDALYHVTVRGDRQQSIFMDDGDRGLLLAIASDALSKFDACMFAYCLMGNHFHFVLRTRQANLSKVMHHINGHYTRAFNKRHGLVGHVFQGRYHDFLVESDPYLRVLCAYVERNPVRAKLATRPHDWPWSSFRAHLGIAHRPGWLASTELLAMVLGRELRAPPDHHAAMAAYESLVSSAPDAPTWKQDLHSGRFLGGADFEKQCLARTGYSA